MSSSLSVRGYFISRDSERLRERAEEAGYDIGRDGLCLNCDGKLTDADLEDGACTQCGALIPALGEDDSY